MRLRRFRRIAALTLLVPVQACSSWHPVAVNPERLIQEQNPSKIRITQSDGRRLILHAPFVVSSDSLLSTITVRRCVDVRGELRRRCFAFPETEGVAYADVTVMETRQFEDASAVVAFMAFASAIIAAVALSR